MTANFRALRCLGLDCSHILGSCFYLGWVKLHSAWHNESKELLTWWLPVPKQRASGPPLRNNSKAHGLSPDNFVNNSCSRIVLNANLKVKTWKSIAKVDGKKGENDFCKKVVNSFWYLIASLINSEIPESVYVRISIWECHTPPCWWRSTSKADKLL